MRLHAEPSGKRTAHETHQYAGLTDSAGVEPLFRRHRQRHHPGSPQPRIYGNGGRYHGERRKRAGGHPDDAFAPGGRHRGRSVRPDARPPRKGEPLGSRHAGGPQFRANLAAVRLHRQLPRRRGGDPDSAAERTPQNRLHTGRSPFDAEPPARAGLSRRAPTSGTAGGSHHNRRRILAGERLPADQARRGRSRPSHGDIRPEQYDPARRGQSHPRIGFADPRRYFRGVVRRQSLSGFSGSGHNPHRPARRRDRENSRQAAAGEHPGGGTLPDAAATAA